MSKNPWSIFLSRAVPAAVTSMVMTWSMGITLLIFLSAPSAAAQAAGEYGHIATATSAASGIGAGLPAHTNKLDSALSREKRSNSTSAPRIQPAASVITEKTLEDATRYAFEQSAGESAATLSLKSLPVKAAVRINGKSVGQTPLQLSLAPGTYKIEMEGPRMESGNQQLALSPKETREVELHLSAAPLYPSHITLQ